MATICRCRDIDEAYELASRLSQKFWLVDVYETVQGMQVVVDDYQLGNRWRRGDLLTRFVASVQFNGITDFYQ